MAPFKQMNFPLYISVKIKQIKTKHKMSYYCLKNFNIHFDYILSPLYSLNFFFSL